jgi:nanoRNase/pAp phosphatase (c-di-AMP/oligoRNAs hydrolase)
MPKISPDPDSLAAAFAVQHPESHQWRTTLTLPAINSSLRCFVVLAGDPALPLTHVRPIYTQLEFFVDQSSASDLN